VCLYGQLVGPLQIPFFVGLFDLLHELADLADRFLLILDMPLALALVAGVLLFILRGRLSRGFGSLLLATYVAWVVLRFWV